MHIISPILSGGRLYVEQPSSLVKTTSISLIALIDSITSLTLVLSSRSIVANEPNDP